MVDDATAGPRIRDLRGRLVAELQRPPRPDGSRPSQSARNPVTRDLLNKIRDRLTKIMTSDTRAECKAAMKHSSTKSNSPTRESYPCSRSQPTTTH